MLKFIHTADIHFGMENYGRTDPATGIHSRLLDFKKALNSCIDRALEEQVDFFLFSGDAYKTVTPSPTQQKLLLQCFLRLYEHDIPVVIVIGNHDNPLSYGKANSLDIFSELPLDGFHVISKPQTVVLDTKHGKVQIVGIPWPTRNTISISNKHLIKDAQQITTYISKAVTHIIKKRAQQLDPELPAILAGHLTISSGIFSGSEKRAIYGTDPILLPSDVAIAPFDYVALGHLHRHQDLNKNGHPPVVYSGSIERIDFGERKEEKGFCLVTIKEKGNTSYKFIRVPTRPFIQIEVHLKPQLGQTDQLLQEIKKHALKDAVVKIVYHVPPDEPDRVDLKRIQQACSAAWFLVGIIPVRTPGQRTQRGNALKVDMNFEQLLDIYFNSKKESPEKKKEFIKKALDLYHQSDQKEESL